MDEAPTRLLWVVNHAPCGNALAQLASDVPPDGPALAAVQADGPWKTPPRHRPIGVVLVASHVDDACGTLHRLRRRSVLPIVVVIENADAPEQHRMLRAGAVAMARLSWHLDPDSATRTRARLRLRRTLELLDEAPPSRPVVAAPQILAIGASTGGPETLRRVLGGAAAFTVPVLIAQHVGPGFDASLANWLRQEALPCRLAEDGDAVQPGVALLARAGHDLVVRDGRCHLEPPSSTANPCVDRLFQSVAREWGSAAIGVLLTGMGGDGAAGLLAMQQVGAFTITQRGDTCVVDGMPATARALRAHCADLTPDEIHARLSALRAEASE